MTVDELVVEFADCVAGQSTCIKQGDATMGNMYAKRYIAAFEKLRSHGDAGRAALTVLFDDPRADVRVMAASYLLRHAEKAAIAVLKAESQKPGLAGFGAEQALERWTDGTWRLDPDDGGPC